MNLFATLADKPWLAQPAPPPDEAARRMPAARVGVLWLLASLTALFSLFAVAFLIRAQLPDWEALAGGAGRPLASLAPLWVNTAWLATASVTLQAASLFARRGRSGALRAALAAGALSALAFLAGQALVWQQLIAQGHFIATNPSASFFYLLTALHGAHLAGGLVAWVHVARRAWRPAADARLALGVALCALYWHFLLAVWLFVFALLAAEPATLVWLAEICGLR